MASYIRGSDGVAVPGDTEHAVAAGLDDELVSALLACSLWDNVFDAAVSTVPASDT